MFFSGKKEKLETILLCDAGSGSVTLALLQIKNNKPVIIWHKNSALQIRDSGKTIEEKKSLLKTIQTLIKDAELFQRKNKDLAKPTKAFVTLSAPWYLSETHRVVIKNDKPTVFTKESLDAELKKNSLLLEEKAKEKSSSVAHYFSDGSQMIEKSILNIKINGYEVDSPLEKPAKELSMDLFMSISPKDIFVGINSLFKESFFDLDVKVHTFPMVHLLALRNVKTKVNNVILIDVSGSTTDITKIENGAIVDSVHIPMGKKSFVNAIMKGYSVDRYIAESMLRLYFSGVSSVRESADVDFMLKDTELLWKKIVSEKINDMQKDGYSCTEHIVSSDQDMLEYIKHSIENISSNKNKELHCVSITSTIQMYNDMVDYSVLGECDPFIALESIYVKNI